MHIMFVDDNPMEKVDHLISYLKEHDVKFTYTIIGDVNSAIQYLAENEKNIDLAVIDLGLPMNDNDNCCYQFGGLTVVEEILGKNPKIPVIISSTTKIPEEKMKRFVDAGLIVKHNKPLYGDKLLRFIQKDSINLIEPYVYDSDVYVFWVNSNDSSVVAKYVSIVSEYLDSFPDTSIKVSGNKITLFSPDPMIEFLVRISGKEGIDLFTKH